MEPKVVSQMPSATFKFGSEHLAWITRRAEQLGMNKSEFLRWLLERDMAAPASHDDKKVA